jgi:PncC family amidohydrolase
MSESVEMKSEERPEKLLVELLKKSGLVMTTAESCTGGLVAATVINVPGASSVIKEGYITYSDETKHKLLGVKKETLQKYKAVSKQTAEEMALGGVRAAKCDICISVTGVAGPDMEDDKPVGLVYVGFCYGTQTYVRELHLTGDRQSVRYQAADMAIRILYELLTTQWV